MYTRGNICISAHILYGRRLNKSKKYTDMYCFSDCIYEQINYVFCCRSLKTSKCTKEKTSLYQQKSLLVPLVPLGFFQHPQKKVLGQTFWHKRCSNAGQRLVGGIFVDSIACLTAVTQKMRGTQTRWLARVFGRCSAMARGTTPEATPQTQPSAFSFYALRGMINNLCQWKP